MSVAPSRIVYTIGYSGLSLSSFLRIIGELGAQLVADVRRFPRSRVPGFTSSELEAQLARHGVEYRLFRELGALGMKYQARFSCVESPTFNAYVNYLVYDDIARLALSALVDEASRKRTVILCRERSPRHCHRQFISDYLLCRGFRVIHIVGGGMNEHEPSSCYGFMEMACRGNLP